MQTVMYYLWFILVFAAASLISWLSFTKIIKTLRIWRYISILRISLNLLLWIGVLVVAAVPVYLWLYDQRWAFYPALVVGLVLSRKAWKGNVTYQMLRGHCARFLSRKRTFLLDMLKTKEEEIEMEQETLNDAIFSLINVRSCATDEYTKEEIIELQRIERELPESLSWREGEREMLLDQLRLR